MEFTQDWFSHNIPNWSDLLSEFRGKPGVRALEIGVFEGRSTCWLLENILTGAGSSVDCIDTFAGGIEHGGLDMSSVKFRFESNTAPWRERVTLHVGNSAQLLPTLSGNFNIIYVDGSHTASDVLTDIVLAWCLAADNAVVIFDDYDWPKYRDQPWLRPQMAIDAFLQCFTGWYMVLHVGYQVVIRKLGTYSPPSANKDLGHSSSSWAKHYSSTGAKNRWS
jgi:hypothetical protein